MESCLLSVLPEMPCIVEAVGFLTTTLNTIMTSYPVLCAAAWCVTLGFLELGIVVLGLIHANHTCKNESAVCGTQCSTAVQPCCRHQGPWVFRKDFSSL